MNNLELTHRRKNPLTGDWVLVSPHRNNRPWSGAIEASNETKLPSYDEKCPLCPTNDRASDTTNPDYQNTFVFVNDFGALVAEQSQQISEETNPLFQAEVANGECRVICFSPDHSKTLPELTASEILALIDSWQINYIELSKSYACVNIFENKGAVMGCSQPHPHGQIWAHEHLSTEVSKENEQQKNYRQQQGSSLLYDYVGHELEHQDRLVVENSHWVVVVPFWAAWPFETLLLPKESIQSFSQLTSEQKQSLAEILKEITTRYDNVFNCSFPYSMGWHSAPANGEDNSHWQLHAHFYPPLLRSATVKKHMVGYEMLAESQRDLTAETAASILKNASSIHYKQRA
ncbi:MAG: UDP-glucose--hexose-1-phosphate uridylyltransferase [Colwellia sp.]|nr:UDP-glucose--hexose-1-phosphate uridylyltransferase [Colwellia sp.]